jgi:chromosome segregation ATPase
VSAPIQLPDVSPERVGKLAAQAAALAGADLAYQLAVSQETVGALVEKLRQVEAADADKAAQLAERDAELARLHTANERLQQQLVRLESAQAVIDVDVDEDQVDEHDTGDDAGAGDTTPPS